MNDRILELAKQAGMEDYPTRGINTLCGNEQIQKFSKLIIRECAAFVSGAAEVHNQVEQDACDRAAIGLRNYFGVEE